MIASIYSTTMVVVEVVDLPRPTFIGRISGKSSSERPGERFLRELVNSLLDGAHTDPQNTVGSHTFAEEKKSQRK